MKYKAFISYNSKDDKWAKWLQQKLESYSIPISMHGDVDTDGMRGRKMRVFRYVSDLNTVSLNDGLARELDDACWLIVISSPNSAKSKWVGKEIQHFIDSGRRNHILPFIVSGTSYSGDNNECLREELKAAFPEGDVLGVNINDYGDDWRIYRKPKALVRIISFLLEVDFDHLWNRYRRRFWEDVALKSAGGLAIAGLIAYALGYHAPFDTQMQLQDLSDRNNLLPDPDSLCVTLMLDNEEKQLVMTSMDDTGTYKNLPGSYAGEKARLTFKAYGYMPVDTMVALERDGIIVVSVRRDDTFGVLAGVVIDEQGSPLNGVAVEAQGEATITNAQGQFELFIPLEHQCPKPKVSFSRKGYRTKIFTEQTVGRHWQVMLLK